MSGSPLVSAIIPAYNAARTIDRTLASVQAQTYPALEIVVVDDGSTDDTANRVQAQAAHDGRIRLLRQSNAGVAAARNAAIQAALGSFIAPIDADDLWMPRKIEAQVEALQMAGESVGLVYSWWMALDVTDKVVGIAHPWMLTGTVVDALLHVNFIGNASVPLFRREIVEAVGGYRSRLQEEGGQGCEDWDLTLRVAERSAATVAPGYLVGYRGEPNSMSSDLDQMARSFEIFVRDAAARNPSLPASLLRYSRGHFYEYLVGGAVALGDPVNVLSRLWKTLRVDPARIGLPHFWKLIALCAWAWLLGTKLSPPRTRPSLPLDMFANAALDDLRTIPQLYSAPGQIQRSWRPFDWIAYHRWKRTCARCKVPIPPTLPKAASAARSSISLTSPS